MDNREKTLTGVFAAMCASALVMVGLRPSFTRDEAPLEPSIRGERSISTEAVAVMSGESSDDPERVSVAERKTGLDENVAVEDERKKSAGIENFQEKYSAFLVQSFVDNTRSALRDEGSEQWKIDHFAKIAELVAKQYLSGGKQNYDRWSMTLGSNSRIVPAKDASGNPAFESNLDIVMMKDIRIQDSNSLSVQVNDAVRLLKCYMALQFEQGVHEQYNARKYRKLIIGSDGQMKLSDGRVEEPDIAPTPLTFY